MPSTVCSSAASCFSLAFSSAARSRAAEPGAGAASEAADGGATVGVGSGWLAGGAGTDAADGATLGGEVDSAGEAGLVAGPTGRAGSGAAPGSVRAAVEAVVVSVGPAACALPNAAQKIRTRNGRPPKQISGPLDFRRKNARFTPAAQRVQRGRTDRAELGSRCRMAVCWVI